MTTEHVASGRALLVSDRPGEEPPNVGVGERFRGRLRKPDFESLYAAHARPLLAFLVYRTGDRMLAEDLLADTFERVLRAKRRFDPSRGSEKTWLYAIALNCVRDHARRHASEVRALELSQGPLDHRSHEDDVGNRDLVRRSLARLSSDERLVISLRFGADLTMPEIAQLVRQPVTTVEGRVYRALGKLRGRIPNPGHR